VRILNCLCGARIESHDADALLAAYLDHTAEQHPEVQLSAARRQSVVDAVLRTGGWDGQTEPLPAAVTIERLDPARAGDYLAYFDGPALCDNPAWASCYCISYELDMDPAAFDERTASMNRAEKLERIERGASSGVMAYAGGRVVGWCHAAPRRALPQLDRTPGFECAEPDRTGAFVCFVVAPQFRGQGLASRLLDGACDMLRDRGLAVAEAYPPKATRSAASGYHGSVRMYEAAGFTQVRDAGRHLVMRKML
jgi:GNAT superfamily N-acetyltransferase